MPRTEVQFRLVFCVLASLFIAACSANKEDIDNTPDINTFNIFIENIDPPGPGAESAAYSYHPETQTLRERARFYQGENLHLEMDTNRDKQGFEYLAFVADDRENPSTSAIYLLDYDKDSLGRVTKLQEFPSQICGIYPIYTRSNEVIDERTPLESIQVNDTLLEVHTASVNTPSCDDQTNLVWLVDFDPSNFGETTLEIKNHITRALITDYSGRDSDNILGLTHHLVDNNKGQLSLLDSDGKTLWSVELPANAQRVYAAQVRASDVIIQTNDRVYSRSIRDLIDANVSSGSSPSPISLEERVFGPYYLQLNNSDEDSPISWTRSSVSDGKRLLIAKEGYFEEIYEIPASVSDFEVIEVSSEQLLIIETENNQDRLVQLNYDGFNWISSQALLNSQTADKISAHYARNNYYVSALNLGGVINGWTSIHSEQSDFQENTFPNTLFITTRKFSSGSQQVYILQSEDITASGALDNPSLFVFDPERPLGRKLKTDDNDEVIYEDDEAQTLGFGRLGVAILSADNLNLELNDKFTRLDLFTEDLSRLQTYFNPSETKRDTLFPIQAAN